MLCYRDMSFCNSDCTNKGCIRFISERVVQRSEETGLPLATCDFSQECPDYLTEKAE
jgi:hypothetical protein